MVNEVGKLEIMNQELDYKELYISVGSSVKITIYKDKYFENKKNIILTTAPKNIEVQENLVWENQYDKYIHEFINPVFEHHRKNYFKSCSHKEI